MKTLPLRVLAPERTFFDGACTSLTVPSIDGMYGLMAQHEDIVLAIVPGKLTLRDADGVEQIAAVSEGDTAQYLTAALRHGAGFGYTAGYKYYVVHTDTDRWMAVFLDCYQQMHAVVTFAWMSLAAMAVCVVLVYGIVVLCSRRAIAPVCRRPSGKSSSSPTPRTSSKRPLPSSPRA